MRWSEREARGLKGPRLCAYASRLIGSDPRLVLWGGGNSSIKTTEEDHAGCRRRVLWVKGSGHDMKSIGPEGFAPLRLDELLLLRSRETVGDGEMVSYQLRCLLDPQAPKPSIETLLHAWVGAEHVYHTHADAVAGFTCAPGSRERTQEAFGGEVLWVPYVRPGFDLAKAVADAVERNPKARALILDKHGALTWGDQARDAYEEMIRLTRRALRYQTQRGRRAPKARKIVPNEGLALQLLPQLRGAHQGGTIVRWDKSPEVLRFLERKDAADLSRRGPFTPDHTLQTKSKPMFWKPSGGPSFRSALDRYKAWYADHFRRFAPKGTPKLDPNPRVVLVPGAGMFTTGRTPAQAAIPAEIYRHAIEVMERVEAFARYSPLDPKHLGEMEFWELETSKYRLQPKEAEFSRKVVLVTGAAGAIGSEAARAFCEKGASIALGDVAEGKTLSLQRELESRHGRGIALAVRLDVGDERSVARAFDRIVLEYGGLDILFSNAGIAKSAPIESLSLADWERNMRVNATGHFLCARRALKIMKAQGLGGAIVFNASKNVLAPGKEFAAYSASKAAEVQLARVLALEAADAGVRVNIVNPDAVFEGSGLWSPAMRRGRARAQGIDPARLEEYYASRNLLKARVTARDVAEAVLFLASARSSKTTGAILPVDGGLREAFPR